MTGNKETANRMEMEMRMEIRIASQVKRPSSWLRGICVTGKDKAKWIEERLQKEMKGVFSLVLCVAQCSQVN